MDFETVIGLEVHAQLLTKSKMFCRCSADYANAPPNTHVCPICLGAPGMLPVINRQAIDFVMMTALALNCTISEYTKFDRKNYNYPDLMKGYQISQFDAPIGLGGWLEIEVDGKKKKCGITRVHLEEDVAKLTHRQVIGAEGYSLVDVNRSGVPLMEVVGEPDLRSPEEARQYLIKLRTILQFLGVSTGNMEEGSFRCDANISIRPQDTKTFGTKCEVKNMNSFKSVYQALDFESSRQRQVTAAGERIVQETRGWVEPKGITVSQRSKEFAHDYRYFPEPDLPPLIIKQEWIAEVRAKLPEMPEARRDRFVQDYSLPLYDANLLTGSRLMADYFEEMVKCDSAIPAKENANWLLGEGLRIMKVADVEFEEFRKKVSPPEFCALIKTSHGEINANTAKTVLEEMFNSGKKADIIISEKGLRQISDTSELEATVKEILLANPNPVADYKAGKKQAVAFLVGQIMRATKGRANAKVVNELLTRKLSEL